MQNESGAFGIFRVSIIKGLKPALQTVYSWLVYHANSKTGECFPGIKLLADECGADRKVIINSIQKLEEMGLIKKERTLGKGNNYTINSTESGLVLNLHQSRIRTAPVPIRDMYQSRIGTLTIRR